MQREKVDSSSIVAIGYDPQSHELEIEFLESLDIYRYFDVPPEEHAAFMAAESKGEYLNLVFKTRGYRYVRIYKGEK